MERIDQPAFKRKLIGMESIFYRAPEANVSLVAHIKGEVDEARLRAALEGVKKLHPLLSAVTTLDENQTMWFVLNEAASLPLKDIPRSSDEQWIGIIQAEYKIAFDFEHGPLIRFILLKSPGLSDLVIFCQHLICDGLSLANLLEEILLLMGDPSLEIAPESNTPLPVPENTHLANTDTTFTGILKKIILGSINKNWAKNKIALERDDFLTIQQAYFRQYQYKIICAELSEAKTQSLIEACHQNQVTVNSAITIAFLAGRQAVLEQYTNRNLGIAVSIRNRLQEPAAKNAFGCFVSTIELKSHYKVDQGFWENVRSFHAQIKKALDKNQDLQALLDTSRIDFGLMQAMTFARHLGYAPGQFDAHPKLSRLSSKSKNIAVTLSKDGMASYPGLLITNLGALKYAAHYGSLELERLYFAPSSIPLPDGGLILGVVTLNQKLTITLNIMERADDSQVVLLTKIKEKAMEILNQA